MKAFFKSIAVFSLVHFLIIQPAALAGGEREKPADTKKEFYSPNAEGLIGFTAEVPLDNPADNIFHVTVGTQLCGDEKVWLVYDLDGVEDHTAVSRSINDQLAVGGYLVKRRKGWATQRERINAAWLREGDNVIRFSMPADAQYSYRIKNLRIEVGAEQSQRSIGQVIVNQPSLHYFYDKAYIKGYVSGAGNENVRIRIAGHEARVFNGEFESIVDFASAENSCSFEIEAVYPDGSTTCHEVSFSQPETADYEYNLDGFTSRSEKYFAKSTAETLSLDGAFLHAAADALRAGATLSITSLRAVDIPALDGGMVNVTKNHAGFRFLPHGMLFSKAADVRIPFDAEKIPDGYTQQDIRTYYFDEQSHHWIALALDTVLLEKGEVISKTLHFTDMINAIIKVPESPEVEAYNSTSMKGIKAANPTAAVNLINPPQANNTGNASLAYPLNLPAGRAGMQPQLAISYNSGGGNGWMGLGWNLSLPAISIDTRWGVPRYDPDSETETYTMNGEQLTPVAHRGTLRPRTSGGAEGVRFYPRVEGAFNKIVRHGDTPADYWWEVTDKSGTRYFYGGSSAGFEEDAVLRTDEPNDKGNAAQWCLREVRDLNGNTVRYHYAKIPDVGVSGGTVPGYQIYIDKVTYTGMQGSDGPYVVQFTRESDRGDKVIMGNLGFKQVTGQRLKRIEVKFENEPIRSYELGYITGEFEKSLLQTLTEFDSKGEVFNTHSFEYYDEVRAGDAFQPLGYPEKWEVPDDGINAGFKTNVDGFKDEATALSGTRSKDKSVGVTVSVGVGFDFFSKDLSAGVSGGYSQSESEGAVVMIDMNGDGLQDKVFSKGGKMFYHPNMAGTADAQEFAEQPIEIRSDGISTFYKEKSKTTSYGGEASFVAFVGYSHNKTKSKVSTYFSDVNGDQLPDIVQNGVVYFNHLDPTTGIITYTQGSQGTPNRIYSSNAVSTDLLDMQALEEERRIALAQNPLLDIVRMWKAPYSGTISITAPLQLLESTDAERADAPADGVRVWIQLRDQVLWKADIESNDYREHRPPALNNLNVNRGDMVFFRVGSKDHGAYDSVRWHPIIRYTDKPEGLRDANGKDVYRFSAGEDFVLSSEQTVKPPFNGQLRVSGDFYKPKTTDDVGLFIIRETQEPHAVDTVWRRNFGWNEEAPALPDTTLAVSNNEVYRFKIFSETNVDWNAMTWRPKLTYVATDNPGVNLATTPIEVTPVVEYSLFANVLGVSKPFHVMLDSLGQRDTVNIFPLLKFVSLPFDDLDNGELTFSVKKTDTLLAKRTIKVTNGKIASDSTLTVPVVHDDSIFIEFHTTNFDLAQRLSVFKASFSIADKDTVVQTGLHTVEQANVEREDVIYGNLYRGWGHFGWNGKGEWEDEPIQRSLMKISDAAKGQNEEINTDGMKGEDLESMERHDPKADRFLLLVADGGTQQWTSGDQHAFVTRDVISSSRLGDDDLSIPSVTAGNDANDDGAFAIDKLSSSTGHAYTLGVSLGLSGSKSKSEADSYTMTEFMDMNGDRYPDIVSEKVIQYTNALGGLSDLAIPSPGLSQKTHATTEGIALTGSFPMTFPKFRKSPKGGSQPQTDGGDAASTSGGISVSGSETIGANNAHFVWMDINADGLPDRVNLDGGTAALNLGYSFADPEPWGFNQIQAGGSRTETGGVGLGINIKQNSFSAGISLARSDNFSNEILMDVNGDGLPDKVRKGNPVQVWINTGHGFATDALSWSGASTISENATASESANASFTVGFGLFGVKWNVSPSGSKGHAMSRDTQKFTDMDGDGFPDFVSSPNESDLLVQRSGIGRTNLLRSVKRPLGASFAMTYSYTGNTYDMPNGLWALDSVIVHDGFAKDGVDSMLTTFVYEDGRYDRREREFYGFAKVISRTHDTGKDDLPVYTQVTQTFANDNYYDKGLLLSDVMTDGDGNKFVGKENEYELREIGGVTEVSDIKALEEAGAGAFPALKATGQKFYEGQSDPGKHTRMEYDYNANGNVTSYTDLGDDSPEDDLNATITYHDIADKYLIGSPESITVTSGGVTLRRRESSIDPETGNVTQIRQYLSEDEVAVYDMEEYDEYGNLKKITRPANAKGQRLSFSYEYDTEVHTYTTKVSNSYGYSSEAKYDVSFGQMVSSKDMNGNEVTYELDEVGRVISITGPYEQGGGNKTIEFEYHPEGQIPWALTRHYDPSDPQNKLETEIYVDGLGRVLQTKKDAAIFQGEGKADTEVMIVSGRVEFDAFGRTVSALYPVTEAKDDTPGGFNTAKDDVKPTLTGYDVLNRTTKVTLPDGAITETLYGFGSDRDGVQQFSTKTTDANGKQTEQFTDVRGRVTAVKNYTSEKDIWTSFKYNAINEQVEATDDLGNTTFSQYDNLGRRITRIHPDAGQTNYRYDLAGNLTQLETANLIKEGMAIEYTYDFERLTNITYPQNAENNVKYTYGEAGASDNRAGRIVLQEDASGAQEFFYGPLGEVVKNIRTIVIPQFDEQTYTTEWQYDTWNRLTSMTYPDGEKVTYNYNAGGLLRSMTGKKKGSTFNYVNQLGYDKFEQRVYLEYGNGTKTTYNYEPDRRRLHNMTAQTKGKRLFMDNVYTYDKVNNILSLENKAPVPASNLMGGSSTYSYDYDDLYRLKTAEGSYKGANETHTYTLSMDYNSVGGIIQKTQVHKKGDQEQKKTTYDLSYTYGETQPHAPIHIGDQTFTYDANGNQTGWTSDVSGQQRQVLWDEENRIRSIYDNGSQHHYVYDAAGERVLKGKTTGQRIFVNGEWKAGSGQMGNYTVYVNPYLVLRSGSYTKHYYIEGQRIVSKLGGGWDNKSSVKAGGNKVDYVGKQQKVFDGIVKNLKFLGADGQVLTAGKSGKVPPGQISGSGNVAEPFRYFYHPDHLGSTSYVTDASGEVFQHMEYFAFGETFVEEHSNTDKTPYLFNGKELDEETGLYYYGARYYDARTSVFLSLDPMAEKYIFQSPFIYAANNPIRLTDVEGEGPGDVVKGFLAAMTDYATFGLTNLRSSVSTESPEDFNKGLQLADAYMVVAAMAEIGGGGGMMGGAILTMEAGVATLIIPGIGEVTFVVAEAAGITELLGGAALVLHGKYLLEMAQANQENKTGYRRKNRLPDKGEPNSTQTNKSGTTIKKYGRDGNVEKEFNRGHGKDAPKSEQGDHVHDYKPNPQNPSGRGERQPGRKPKKNELPKDFGITE